MRGLDEQIQEIKSDSLRMSAELSQLEEKLLYPSGTQVAVFVELAKGDAMRLDAVRLQIDGQLVAHYIYSAKELQALRKGGVQRIYVGNVATGDHKLEVLVDGKLEGGADFSRTGEFTFRKEVKPKLVGLTLAGPRSGNTPITLGGMVIDASDSPTHRTRPGLGTCCPSGHGRRLEGTPISARRSITLTKDSISTHSNGSTPNSPNTTFWTNPNSIRFTITSTTPNFRSATSSSTIACTNARGAPSRRCSKAPSMRRCATRPRSGSPAFTSRRVSSMMRCRR